MKETEFQKSKSDLTTEEIDDEVSTPTFFEFLWILILTNPEKFV